MTRIKKEIFELTYYYCNRAFDFNTKKFDIRKKEDGVEELVKAGYDKNSAEMTFRNFDRLMNGEILSVNMPSLHLDVFLSNINRDYGAPGLRIALDSVRKYLDRYKLRHPNSDMHLIRELYNRYLDILKNNSK